MRLDNVYGCEARNSFRRSNLLKAKRITASGKVVTNSRNTNQNPGNSEITISRWRGDSVRRVRLYHDNKPKGVVSATEDNLLKRYWI